MGESCGPHRPKEGWETRWPKEAITLMIRAPLGALTFLAGVGISAYISMFLESLMSGPMGYVLSGSISASIGGIFIILTVRSLMIDEGYDPRPEADIREALRSVSSALFLISSVILTISVLIFLWSIAAGAKPLSESVPQRTPIGDFIWSGVHPVMSGLLASILVNPLWLAMVPSLASGFTEARQGMMGMIVSMREVWLAILAVVLIFTNVMTFLPGVAPALASYFLLVWLYVAAREIFGGITGNKSPSRLVKTSFQEA